MKSDKTRKVRIFVDMDNTLCDFSGAQKAAVEKEPGIKWPQCQMDFFRNLKPLTGAIESFHKLDSYYDMHILTRPSVENLMCLTEKGVWVRDNLGQEFLPKLHLSCHKEFFAEKGDAILIDDNIWEGFKGEQIHFGTGEFVRWGAVLDYLIKK